MIRKSQDNRSNQLTPAEISLCQRAFDSFLTERNIARDSEEAEQTAAIIIEAYQQGIRDEQQLLLLANAAHGTS